MNLFLLAGLGSGFGAITLLSVFLIVIVTALSCTLKLQCSKEKHKLVWSSAYCTTLIFCRAGERPALSLATIPEEEIAMTADDNVPPHLLYEEIRDVPASQSMRPQATTSYPYEEVEAVGLQQTAEPKSDSYHFTLCSAYGVSMDKK